MSKEIWNDIPGFKGWYQFSNKERIKSLERTVLYKDGRVYNYKERILKIQIGKAGYKVITCCKNDKGKLFYIHRLIGLFFVKGYFKGAVIHHRNFNVLDNRPVNLKWTTQKNNCLYTDKAGRYPVGSKRGHSKLTEQDVFLIKSLIKDGFTYKSIAEVFGICESNISYIKRNLTWKHV